MHKISVEGHFLINFFNFNIAFLKKVMYNICNNVQKSYFKDIRAVFYSGTELRKKEVRIRWQKSI